MGQGLIVAILSLLFYLSNLLGGGMGQPIQPLEQPNQIHSYQVLGQTGEIALEQITLRTVPQADGLPNGTARKGERVMILDQQTDWYKIRLGSGLSGWVPNYAVLTVQKEPPQTSTMIMSHFEINDSVLENLAEHSHKLTSVVAKGWQINSYGEITANFEPEKMGHSLYLAGNQELETFGRFSIKDNPLPLLTSTSLQEQTLTTVLETTSDWGLKGIFLEFDFVPNTNASELFELTSRLRQELNAKGRTLLLSLPWSDSFDYSAAAEVTDYLVLQNNSGLKSPDPAPLQDIKSLEQMLARVSEQVSSNKIILTVATGGLDWPKAGLPTTLSHEELLNIAAAQGASIKWDNQAKAPYFHYGAGHEVWFENHYSLKYKIDLAQQYKIGGIVLPNLGQEDPEAWDVFSRLL